MARTKGATNKLKAPPEPIGIEDEITIRFLDRETFKACWRFLNGRRKVSLGDFLLWTRRHYGFECRPGGNAK